jgi:hypothetical protein
MLASVSIAAFALKAQAPKPAAPATSQMPQESQAKNPTKTTPSNSGNTSSDQPAKTLVGQTSAQGTDTLLKITLSPSETPLRLASTSNIAANIQNISDKPIKIGLSSIELGMDAVLSHDPSLCSAWMSANWGDYPSEITLQPHDEVGVIFDLSRKATPSTAIQDVTLKARTARDEAECDIQRGILPSLSSLDFVPGDYDFSLSGTFTVCQRTSNSADQSNGAGTSESQLDCSQPWRPFTKSATFPVGLGQRSIVIWAMCGGLFAFLFVTVNSKENTSLNIFISLIRDTPANEFRTKVFSLAGLSSAIQVMAGVIGAVLLAAAFTVVSSRLSDTHFPIKVSVQDAWGAITIGFVSYFVGGKFIEWLSGLGGGKQNPTNPPPNAAPNPDAKTPPQV